MGTAVPYDVFAFTVDVTSAYSFVSTPSPHYDNFLALYKDSFSPDAALANLVFADDDDPDGVGGTPPTFVSTLTAGTLYFLVTTGYENFHAGDFTNTIDGPGVVSPTAVPEPATLLLLGAGLTGLAARRRRSIRQ